MTGLRVSYQHAIPCYTRRWDHDEQCEYERTALSKEDVEHEEMERGQDRRSNRLSESGSKHGCGGIRVLSVQFKPAVVRARD